MQSNKYYNLANKVINLSDIICEVLDARFPYLTRNETLEQQILSKGKKLIFAINKADLTSINQLKKIKSDFKPSVFLSAKKRLGTTILKRYLSSLSKGKPIVIGIIGYPNTGKSSIINSLSGRRSARVSPISGFTKGIQYIKMNSNVMIIDSPGVVPIKKDDEIRLAILGSIDPTKIKDSLSCAENIIKIDAQSIIAHYKLKPSSDTQEEILNKIAENLKMLLPGGIPDINRASRKVIFDWQKGKIKFFEREKNELLLLNKEIEDQISSLDSSKNF